MPDQPPNPWDDGFYDNGAALWGWIAAAVVFALVFMFVFVAAGPGHSAPLPKIGPVTATVTQVQLPTGKFHVLLTNNETGVGHPWARKGYDNKFACDQAIRGINDALRAIADPDPKVVPIQPELADPELVMSVTQVLNFLRQNTGKNPDLSISCSEATAPTRAL